MGRFSKAPSPNPALCCVEYSHGSKYYLYVVSLTKKIWINNMLPHLACYFFYIILRWSHAHHFTVLLHSHKKSHGGPYGCVSQHRERKVGRTDGRQTGREEWNRSVGKQPWPRGLRSYSILPMWRIGLQWGGDIDLTSRVQSYLCLSRCPM